MALLWLLVVIDGQAAPELPDAVDELVACARFAENSESRLVSLKAPSGESLLMSMTQSFMPMLIQAAAFDAWMEHVEAAQKRRQLLLRTIARLSQLRLSQAFEAWRSTVSDVQEAYGRAAKVQSSPRQNSCAGSPLCCCAQLLKVLRL